MVVFISEPDISVDEDVIVCTCCLREFKYNVVRLYDVQK